MIPKVLLFDLDDTLLRSDKTISPRTLEVLNACREKGLLLGICTSRSEKNIACFVEALHPDIVIASGGAVVRFRGECVFVSEFSVEETRELIAAARKICGEDVEIAVDTLHKHYWNYSVDPNIADASWGDVIHTRYENFFEKALKVTVDIRNPEHAEAMKAAFPDYDCLSYVGTFWHKFTHKDATKESAIRHLCSRCGIPAENLIGFGDDVPDIGMLQLCGVGVAMGNAREEVKKASDVVIGTNDGDGIADYLTKTFLT